MAEDAGIGQWIEALGAGECAPEEFLDVVLEQAQGEPDAVWEALSLLDQHFRRKLIPAHTYAVLKTSLQQHSVGMRQVRRGAPVRAPAGGAGPAIGAAAASEPRPASATTPPESLSPQSLRAGDLLCGRYRVVELLQRDASGTLVEAIDEPRAGEPGIPRRLAIQVMKADSSLPMVKQRIGRLQASSHPGIPRIFDVEQAGGALLLSMELLKGATLRQLLDRSGMPLATPSALAILRGVASVLADVHASGASHGAVAIPNVFITDLGEVRLRGFGLTAASAGDIASDRLAFASLVYELLAGGDDMAPAAKGAGRRWRRPAGITSGRWRWLHAALEGNHAAAAMLLTAFADDAGALSARVGALHAFEPARPRKGLREWVATSMLLLLVLTVGFVYVTSRDQQSAQFVAQAAITDPPVEPQQVLPVAEVAAPLLLPEPAEPAPEAPVMAVPRIDLPSDAAWVETTESVARIWVRRRGNVEQAVSFRWWTESGSALPDRDFRTVTPRNEVIPRGARGIDVLVPLVPDAARGEARTFFVKIDAEGAGVSLGSRTLMQVAIVPPGYPAAR